MKKFISISLLSVFCVYSFTFKTHYCYYADTHERYHGDCQKHIKEAAEKGELADQNIFPAYYYCLDILRNAQFSETKFVSVKSPFSGLIFSPSVTEIIVPVFTVYHLLPPEPKCRSAPIISAHSLRAPPIC